MADFGQEDEVVSKPSAAPAVAKSSWGADDEVVTKPSEDRVSSSSLSDLVADKKIPTTAGGTFARSAVESAAATPAALLGARAGFALTPPVLPFVGPFAKPIGGVVGAIAGGLLGAEGIDAIEGAVDSVFGTNIRNTKKQQQKEYPTAALLGQVAGGAVNPWMKIGLAGSAKQAALGAGVMVGVGAGGRAVSGGDIFDPKAIGADIFAGGLTTPRDRGKRLLGLDVPERKSIHSFENETGLPPDQPSITNGATPEKIQAFVDELKANKTKKDSQAKVVQTAFKNNETGELELYGPIHDPVRKTETVDTHTQGFIDENGNFLDRKEAWNRARDLGQVEELSDIKVGLQSSDLRAANDKNFEFFNVPETLEGVPVTIDKTMTRKTDGTKVGARYKRETNEISIDPEHIYNQFKDKAWSKPKVEGVFPIAEDAFKTPQEWADFVLQHEAEHVRTPIAEGQTKAQYENQTNKAALEVIAEKKAKATDTPVDTELERAWRDFEDWDPLIDATASPYPGAKKRNGTYVSRDGKYSAVPTGGNGFTLAPNKVADFIAEHGFGASHLNQYAVDAAMAIREGKSPETALKKLKDDLLRLVENTEEITTTLANFKVELNKAFKPVDRTKTNPRDVKDQQEFKDIAQEIYEKHGEVEAVKFYEGYEKYKQSWNEPIAETEKFVGTNLRAKAADERIIHNNTSDLKALAGKEVNLTDLTYAIDKGAVLTGKAKEVADKFRTLMDDLGKKALENGVIKGWHQDYVARNVVTEGAAPSTAIQEFIRDVFGYEKGVSGAKTTTKYGQQRKLETRQDLVDHLEGINSWLTAKGLDYRFKLKSDNLADIYHDYALSVEKAIENKNLINNLKQIRNVNGESLIRPITPEDPLPYQWEVMDNSELAGYAVHPDLIPHLKFVFDAAPGELMSALGSVSQFVKRINVVGSFFHAKSLMEVMSSTGIPIWTPLKEAIVLPLVEKGVKAITGKDIQLSAISKAVEQFKKGGVGTSVDKWIREDGLQLEVPEDVSKNILSASGKLVDSLIGKFGPKTRVLEKSLTTVEKYTLGYFDKYTWDYLHTGGKLMVAEAYLDKARLSAAKEGRPFDESASRKEIARFLNDSFGGLNWYDAATQTQNEFAKRVAMAAYSPAGRRSLQIALFAPDWTISTLRAFSSALPKGLNPTKWQPVEGIKGMMTPTTKADYARLYQFKTALTYLTMLNAINMVTADRPIWENKDPTRIEFPDGTSMQAMKHAMEPAHWIMDPTKTLANKLGFIPKAAIVSIAGTEYASPQAQKLIDPSAAGRLKAVASMAVPFQVAAARDAPPGEGAKRALLGTMGFPVYGGTPEQKKAARAEREKVLKEAAKKYHQKAKEKGWEK
jgi:hypothetical protein